jgi:hypothetical protein
MLKNEETDKVEGENPTFYYVLRMQKRRYKTSMGTYTGLRKQYCKYTPLISDRNMNP